MPNYDNALSFTFDPAKVEGQIRRMLGCKIE